MDVQGERNRTCGDVLVEALLRLLSNEFARSLLPPLVPFVLCHSLKLLICYQGDDLVPRYLAMGVIDLVIVWVMPPGIWYSTKLSWKANAMN